MIKIATLKIFIPTICYIFLLTQTTIFYLQKITAPVLCFKTQTVANVIQTGSADSSSLLIQKQQNNEKLAQLKIDLAGGKDVQSQIDSLTQANQTISQQLQQNANQGSITINSANQVNILASQNQTSNNYSFNASSFVGTTSNEEELKSATTVSPLLSSNDITINAGNNGDGNINLLSAILTGEGNLNLNGNVNMQSLQDSYYSYSHHELTSMNIGALIAELLAAAIIGALTAGAGAALIMAAELSTVVVSTSLATAIVGSFAMSAAITGAGIAALGVVTGIGIDAAIDAKNGGASATKDMQSGSGNETIAQYNSNNGGSLLFSGNVNIGNSNNIDVATDISSSNLNQTAQINESVFYRQTSTKIDPNWNNLMTNAAITGVISGVTVAGTSPFLNFTKNTTGLQWINKFNSAVADSPLKITILGHPIYPGVEMLTRSGLEAGASSIENLSHNND